MTIEWFSLELEVAEKISRVQIARRVDAKEKDRDHNFIITVGPSQSYDPNEPLCLPVVNLTLAAGLQDYNCTGDLHEGKFVKISRGGTMNLCEAKVFTLQQPITITTGGSDTLTRVRIMT